MAQHGGNFDQHNYAVWAFKRRGRERQALEDFGRLDEMFVSLQYPLGFFINVASDNDYLESYTGEFCERIVGIAIMLKDGVPHFTVRRGEDVVRQGR